MKGDFSRNTFRPSRHYSRVLMQQGRVLLDSDWNEQGSIFLHYLQSLAQDLIGPFGGPASNCGFRVISRANDPELPAGFPEAALRRNFGITRGHYYVDGLLCENDAIRVYAQSEAAQGLSQTDLLADELVDGKHLVYLDVWEQHQRPTWSSRQFGYVERQHDSWAGDGHHQRSRDLSRSPSRVGSERLS